MKEEKPINIPRRMKALRDAMTAILATNEKREARTSCRKKKPAIGKAKRRKP